MICFLHGILDSIDENSIISDVNGIGYEVFVSTATASKLTKTGDSVKIYTYMQAREDCITLYGFISKEEQSMFNLLITVNGIGAKVALSILSCLKPVEIMMAIITEDVIRLSKVPGIGKKTAGRLILELKDKIKTNEAIAETISPQQSVNIGGSSCKQDALDALIALGYSRSEALKSVLEVAVEGMTTEQIIKQTLRKLSSYNA